jgi:hypothetical protein
MTTHGDRRHWLLGVASAGLAACAAGTRDVVAQDVEPADIPLKTTAALAVAFAYQTQTSLGLTADAFAHKLHDKPTCAQLLKSAIGFLSPLIEQLEDVSELELDEADKMFFEKLVESLRLLKDEAEALDTFVNTGRESDRKPYLDLREQAKVLLDGLVKGGA